MASDRTAATTESRLPVQARADASGGGSRVTWRGLYLHDPGPRPKLTIGVI